MSLVAAKCTQCGANIQVDDSKEAGICQSCGTAFITEKVISNYKIVNNTTIENAIINVTNVENKEEFHTISILRGYDNCKAIEIIVDDITYAIIENNQTIDILLDKNKTHRLYCIFGDEKSNVIFLDKGEKTNIKVVLTVSKTVKISGVFSNDIYTFYSPKLEKTSTNVNDFKIESRLKKQKELEEENKKKRRKTTTIISIILSIVFLFILIPIVNNCNAKNENEDIKKYSVEYDGYVITLETCVFISYRVTNLSSKSREYACYYEIITQDDTVIAEGGNLVSVTIKPGESEIVTATCNPTSQGIKKGYKYFTDKKMQGLRVRISQMKIDGRLFT